MSSSVEGWIVSPRKSRRKSSCLSRTTVATPARANSSPSIIPAGPPPAMQQRTDIGSRATRAPNRVSTDSTPLGTLGVPLGQRRCPRLHRLACQGDSAFLTVRVSLGRRLFFYPPAVNAIRAWHASCPSHLAGVGHKTSDSRERRALGRAGDRRGALGTDAGMALLAAHRGLTALAFVPSGVRPDFSPPNRGDCYHKSPSGRP